MMKNQLKQFLIAGAVLAVLAALFFGWRSWYYRPQTCLLYTSTSSAPASTP